MSEQREQRGNEARKIALEIIGVKGAEVERIIALALLRARITECNWWHNAAGEYCTNKECSYVDGTYSGPRIRTKKVESGERERLRELLEKFDNTPLRLAEEDGVLTVAVFGQPHADGGNFAALYRGNDKPFARVLVACVNYISAALAEPTTAAKEQICPACGHPLVDLRLRL